MKGKRVEQVVWSVFEACKALQVTVVDARAGENLLVYKDDASQGGGGRTESQFDACASWWTQVQSFAQYTVGV